MSKLTAKLRKAAEDLYIHKQTRRDIASAASRLEAITEVWGHQDGLGDLSAARRNKLRAEWPELASALDTI